MARGDRLGREGRFGLRGQVRSEGTGSVWKGRFGLEGPVRPGAAGALRDMGMGTGHIPAFLRRLKRVGRRRTEDAGDPDSPRPAQSGGGRGEPPVPPSNGGGAAGKSRAGAGGRGRDAAARGRAGASPSSAPLRTAPRRSAPPGMRYGRTCPAPPSPPSPPRVPAAPSAQGCGEWSGGCAAGPGEIGVRCRLAGGWMQWGGPDLRPLPTAGMPPALGAPHPAAGAAPSRGIGGMGWVLGDRRVQGGSGGSG